MKQLKGKKALAAILTAAMTMSLMACGSSGNAATEEKPAEETQETAAAETPAAEAISLIVAISGPLVKKFLILLL